MCIAFLLKATYRQVQAALGSSRSPEFIFTTRARPSGTRTARRERRRRAGVFLVRGVNGMNQLCVRSFLKRWRDYHGGSPLCCRSRWDLWISIFWILMRRYLGFSGAFDELIRKVPPGEAMVLINVSVGDI